MPDDNITQLTPKAKAPEPAKASPPAPANVMFESTNPEPIQFDVCGVRGHRDLSGKKVVWRVPAEKAERFSRHSHVLSGRIRQLTPAAPAEPAKE